jgi:uncharacterized protein involved in exopolysaccharide biosynthesis
LNITDEKARQTVESATTTTPEEQPYWSKRRELEDLLRYRATLAQRLLSEAQENRLKGGGGAEIVDRAIGPSRPARPNKPLNIVLGIFSGAILGLLAGLGTWVVSGLIRRTQG